jgi:hypothetical protein
MRGVPDMAIRYLSSLGGQVVNGKYLTRGTIYTLIALALNGRYRVSRRIRNADTVGRGAVDGFDRYAYA